MYYTISLSYVTIISEDNMNILEKTKQFNAEIKQLVKTNEPELRWSMFARHITYAGAMDIIALTQVKDACLRFAACCNAMHDRTVMSKLSLSRFRMFYKVGQYYRTEIYSDYLWTRILRDAEAHRPGDFVALVTCFEHLLYNLRAKR